MKKFNPDVFLIDLSKVRNTMFKDLLIDNDLDISVDFFLNFKREGYIKIWVDKSKMEVIAYTLAKSKVLFLVQNNGVPTIKGKAFQDYISFLESITPLVQDAKLVKKEVTEVKKEVVKVKKEVQNENYTIDSILDKINLVGMGALSKEELEFLQNI